MLAKINISSQFTHNLEITIVNAFAPQRRNAAQRRTQSDRPQINVQAERLAQPQQTSFRALIERQTIPLRSADRAEQNRIGRTAAGQRLRRQRRAKTLDRSSAKRQFAEFEFMFERFRAVFQNLHRSARYFRSDSVARQYGDGLPYSRHDCDLPY